MTEESILARLPRKHRNLVLGIGDDCAIYRPRPTEDLVFTTDLFIEGVHCEAGNKACARHRARPLARSLSDIAAMGATPRFCLVSLAVPYWADAKFVAKFFDGLQELAQQTNTPIAGGDLSHTNKLICDVMVCGSVPRGKALRRDGAHPGDGIYVSGPLGGWRHRPNLIPRLEEGRKLRGRATACIDISDGLALDLHRLCVASKVSAALDNVPLLKRATEEQALHDGEDYELLYTAPARTRIPGIRIGTITKGNAGAISLQGKNIAPKGYDHFSNRT